MAPKKLLGKFELKAPFRPTGDQPQAIDALVRGLALGAKQQTLLGVTGSGKTFTVANVIAKANRPTLVICHNKTLAAQSYQEFKEFFPNNAVEYFVSYYDYYQPEAYIPHTDTYIEKETEINEEIDKLRLSTTTSLLTRRDVIVVASVSCIYNLGSPKEYGETIILVRCGQSLSHKELTQRLTELYYTRNDSDFHRSTFRIKGEYIDVYPSYMEQALRIELADSLVLSLAIFDPLTGKTLEKLDNFCVYPAKHYITPPHMLKSAVQAITKDLKDRVAQLTSEGKLLEAQRIQQRTLYDLEMINEFGYCNGIENYSLYFDGRNPGDSPHSLLNYFPKDYLIVIDESHVTIPQIRGMYAGDRSRKETLMEYGFRLPSALDNRPLRFDEFMRCVNQIIYTSATPDDYELSISDRKTEQLIRPTGLLDPQISVCPTEKQIENLIAECKVRVTRGERVLVTTVTKRLAEDLSEYLVEQGLKAHYLHSDIDTLKRSEILDSLRSGTCDIVVGINLLREGLDLPEVSLVAILDADKEGFLRSTTSLIQVMGRAARHVNGAVIMYADSVTRSMEKAIAESDRRRKKQLFYNARYGVVPTSIIKPLRARLAKQNSEEDKKRQKFSYIDKWQDIGVEELRVAMHQAALVLDFEKAAYLRDLIKEKEAYFKRKQV